jgi:hypothetical protein
VIDQIVGQDRRGLLRDGIDAASARGDAQVVVVSGADDVELAEVSASLGFRRVVDLIGSPRS